MRNKKVDNGPKRTNWIEESVARSTTGDTLTYLDRIIGSSLGPYGENTLIEKGPAHSEFSKDGFTILTNVLMEDSAARMILDMIRTISIDQVGTVGDGTTSAIIIAASLYHNLIKVRKNFRIPSSKLRPILDRIKSMITRELNKIVDKDITQDKLNDIARVSSNYDEVIVDTIQEIHNDIGWDAIIDVKKSRDTRTTSEVTAGFKLEDGWLHESFSNQANRLTGRWSEPRLLINSDGFVDNDIPFLTQQFMSMFVLPKDTNKPMMPLVIIANSYSPKVKEFLVQNMRSHKDWPLMAGHISSKSIAGSARVKNLLALTGAMDFKKLLDMSLKNQTAILWSDDKYGRCDEVIASAHWTKIVNPWEVGSPAAEERFAYIEQRIADVKKQNAVEFEINKEVERLEAELMNLSGKAGVIYVGGETEQEKENRVYLLDDAVLAVRATVKSGILPGCNIAVSIALEGLTSDDIAEISKSFGINIKTVQALVNAIKDTYREPIRRVINNADLFRKKKTVESVITNCIKNRALFDLRTEEYDPIDQTRVINSMLTETSIMNSAFSICGMFTMTNQMLQFRVPIQR